MPAGPTVSTKNRGTVPVPDRASRDPEARRILRRMAKRRSRKGGGGRGRGASKGSAPRAAEPARDEPEAETPKAEAAAEEAQGAETPEISRPRQKKAERPRRGRAVQIVRRSVLALSLLLVLVLPVAGVAGAMARAGAAPAVGGRGPGIALAEALPGLATLGEVVSGSVWSMTLGGLEVADPLAAALVAVAGGGAVLLVAAILPVAGTLLLGRVFCGWLCPARLPVELASWLRRRLKRRATLRAPWLRWVKYGVLAAGLGLAALTGWSLVALIYPPAILVREAQLLLLHGAAGWGAVVVGGAFALDLFVDGGAWCRGLCPGGALYSLLATPAPLRMRFDEERCTRCDRCGKVCPMGLDPTSELGGECDRCGLCQRECRDDALHYRLGLPAFVTARQRRRHGRKDAA